jgi:hypothetical protein
MLYRSEIEFIVPGHGKGEIKIQKIIIIRKIKCLTNRPIKVKEIV